MWLDPSHAHSNAMKSCKASTNDVVVHSAHAAGTALAAWALDACSCRQTALLIGKSGTGKSPAIVVLEEAVSTAGARCIHWDAAQTGLRPPLMDAYGAWPVVIVADDVHLAMSRIKGGLSELCRQLDYTQLRDNVRVVLVTCPGTPTAQPQQPSKVIERGLRNLAARVWRLEVESCSAVIHAPIVCTQDHGIQGQVTPLQRSRLTMAAALLRASTAHEDGSTCIDDNISDKIASEMCVILTT